MSAPRRFDMSELRAQWREQRDALEALLRRIDVRGMTRPARDPEEREWLRERGALGPFVEDERCAAAAREYYARRYSK